MARRPVVHRAAVPGAAAGRGTAHRNGRATTATGCACTCATPGDLESLELVAFDRVPPGPGQIEVAVSASSINFADVLVAFGRCPSFDGRLPELGSRVRWRGHRGRPGRDDPQGRRPRRRRLGQRLLGHLCHLRGQPRDDPARRDRRRRKPPRSALRYATAWLRPRTSWPDHRGRQGADPLRDRWRRAGGDRHRAGRRCRDLRHRWQRRAAAVVARLGDRARLRLPQHRVRRPDPQGHRRIRRRHRAQLRHRRCAARWAGAARLRWTLHRDRQARHLRRHPAWPVPVPAQSVVLRRRPRADDHDSPRQGPRAARRRCTN